MVPKAGQLAAQLQVGKTVSTPVPGLNNTVADKTSTKSADTLVFLRPGGEPTPIRGTDKEQFMVTLTPAKAP